MTVIFPTRFLRGATLLTLILVVFFTVSCRDAKQDASAPPEPAQERVDSAADSTLRLAFVGFSDADTLFWRETARGTNLEIESFTKEDFIDAPLETFDFVALRAIGWKPTDADHERLARLMRATRVVGLPQTLDFAREATNVSLETTERLYEYSSFLCDENIRSAAAIIAEQSDAPSKRKIRNLKDDGDEWTVADFVAPPKPGYFYWGARVDDSYEAFERRRDSEGRSLPPDAPRVALFGSFLQPFKSMERGPQDELIRKLESRGFNVYPIYDLKKNKNLLTECKPDLAIYFPLGRVLPDGEAVELFNELDVPVLSAVTLTVNEEEWRNQPIGSTGSYYSLAVALPELDGVTNPIPIAVREPDENGFVTRRALSERIDLLVERCSKEIALRRKTNAEKKLAIFYYKAPGASALTAQSLEVVESLYNTLSRLRDAGYELGDEFPASSAELQARIEREGKTIGQWELGTLAKFIDEARPALVPANVYEGWLSRNASEQARKEIIDVWGPAPGKYMTADVGDIYGLLVPRIQFGNVVLIPQPTTDVLVDAPYSPQDDDFDAVHGKDKAPPHFYIAAYFWARESFDADVIVHFGTHGSLEFTKGKTAFLTESCYPDMLIGSVPHVYLYSINNIGEAFLAKRRTRATLISHLTPPFTKSELYSDLQTFDDKLHEYLETAESALKEEYRVSVVEMTLQSSLIDDLRAEPEFSAFDDPTYLANFIAERKTFSEKQIETLHKLLHRYENVTVTNGLHVLDRPWTDEQIEETAQQSSIGEEEAAQRLRASFTEELDQFMHALDSGYILPSTGGDFLVNPDSAPTGRNLAGLDVERLPTPESERVATKLTDELLDQYRATHDGSWPRRVACTLWGGETVRTQGAGIAQVLALLGVRIKRDSRGVASDLELIPSDELGRPRIDVLVQTSGQFRDSFGSRIVALDRAVRLVVQEAPEDEPFPNYVRENSHRTAERLVSETNVSREEAEELSTARVFGATNALSYGTGIMSLVERGDMWNDESQIADRYIANMSGVYRGPEYWGRPTERLLELNLEGVDLMAQTRSSNVWGPAKLDHIYEFSTLAVAVRAKTGRDPEIWFDDLRSPSNPRIESARAALREELRTTIWNPKYLQGLQREGASAAASTAKTVRNLFGWNVAQPATIDQSVWEETTAVFVDDVHNLGAREWFEEKNPSALQDMTAIMLEAIRKDYWKASQETTEKIARLHAELVEKFGPSGSYESTGNQELRKFVKAQLPDNLADAYAQKINEAVEVPAPDVSGMELREETLDSPASPQTKDHRRHVLVEFALLIWLGLLVAFASGFFLPEKIIVDQDRIRM